MAEPLPPIVLTIETPATRDDAWAALTEPQQIAEWFTEASPLGDVGDLYRLDFGEGSIVEGVITLVEPGRRFAHTWVWTDAEPSPETIVTWSIEPSDTGGSRITLTHAGWAEAGVDMAIREDHEAYWGGYLEDLEAILAGRG